MVGALLSTVRKLWTQLQPPCPSCVLTTFWLHLLSWSTQMELLAETYGNIYTLWFGWTPVIILNGFQAVKDGMTTHPEDVSGRMVSPFFRALVIPSGIILASGHHWKHSRRFSLVTLRNLGLGKKSLEAWIQEEACCLIEVFARERGEIQIHM
uniref:Uncharacterized protein n=1 Tax=Otus sunia TaxID=257818 RepID=A0A8C8AT88_9STRI